MLTVLASAYMAPDLQGLTDGTLGAFLTAGVIGLLITGLLAVARELRMHGKRR